ncbi:hypothetical protein [Roseateles sp.]|uniref:hypothetical protein n=1 Tax=Roseateles sp. TaxID=1971397 RepID=UPI0039605E04
MSSLEFMQLLAAWATEGRPSGTRAAAAAAQAGLRHRHANLPELRRRGAEDHRDSPESAMKSLTPSEADGPERLLMAYSVEKLPWQIGSDGLS